MCEKCRETAEGRALWKAYEAAQSEAMKMTGVRLSLERRRDLAGKMDSARDAFCEYHNSQVGDQTYICNGCGELEAQEDNEALPAYSGRPYWKAKKGRKP